MYSDLASLFERARGRTQADLARARRAPPRACAELVTDAQSWGETLEPRERVYAPVPRTTRTGSSALCTRLAETEPSTVDATIPRPRLPATISAAPSVRGRRERAPGAGRGFDSYGARVQPVLAGQRRALWAMPHPTVRRARSVPL